jgi:hypothetical protein
MPLLVQPEAAPLLPSHSQLTHEQTEVEERDEHRSFSPAGDERRHGRTNARVFSVLQCGYIARQLNSELTDYRMAL